MTSNEEISRASANQNGKTDSNLANDTLHVGGIPAEDMATKKYVQQYHDTKEAELKQYIDNQDNSKLETAKAYTDEAIEAQDFSNFAKINDVQAVNQNLTNKINNDIAAQKQYTDGKIQDVVDDVNANFDDVGNSINTLNTKTDQLFTSVSNGKTAVAGAITDKGVPTSANDTFSTMAKNIRQIEGGGVIPPGYVNTNDATATEDKIALGYTAYAKGQKLTGTLGQGGTATPYDIRLGKSAYVNNQLIDGLLTIDESTGKPSYSVGDVEKVYGTAPIKATISELNYNNDNLDRSSVLLINSTFNTIEGKIKATSADSIIMNADSGDSNESTFNLKQFLQNKGFFTSATSINFNPLAASGNFKINQNQGGYVIGALTVTGVSGTWIIVLHLVVQDTQSSGGHIYSWKVDEENMYVIKSDGVLYSNDSVLAASMPNTTLSKYFLCCSERSVATCKLSEEIWSSGDSNGLEGFKKIEGISKQSVGTNIYQSQFNKTPIFSYRNDNRICFITNSRGYNYADNHGNSYWETYTTVLMLSTTFHIDTYNFYSTKMTPSGDGLKAIDTSGNIYNFTYNWDSYSITRTLERTLTNNPHVNLNYDGTPNIIARILNKDGTLMYQFEKWYTKEGTSNNYYRLHYGCYIFKVDFSTEDVAEYLQDFGTKYDAATSSQYTYAYHGIPSMINFGIDENILLYATDNHSSLEKMFLSVPIIDYSEVVALKYNNQYYYPIKGGVLTAGQPDVRKGKTFIGWLGQPETGTMEV